MPPSAPVGHRDLYVAPVQVNVNLGRCTDLYFAMILTTTVHTPVLRMLIIKTRSTGKVQCLTLGDLGTPFFYSKIWYDMTLESMHCV